MKALREAKRDQAEARSVAKLILAVMYNARTNRVNLIWCNGYLHVHIRGKKAEREGKYRVTRAQLQEIVSYLGQHHVEMRVSQVAGSRCGTAYH